MDAMVPARLRVEHDPDPLDVGSARPRLSWWLPDGIDRQTAYRIDAIVDGRAVESDPVVGDRSFLVPWPFDDLSSRSIVEWRVQVEHDGAWSEWSEPHRFEVPLLSRAEWTGDFIGLPGDGRDFGTRGARGAVLFRRTFDITEPVERARLRASALGIYEVTIDGVRVGERELTPGFTSYRSTLEAQNYDITELLAPGRHELISTVTDGWYRGSVGFTREEFSYGDRLAFIAQIDVTDTDGTSVVLATDRSWEVACGGPIVAADLMEGESIDLRRPLPTAWVAVEPVTVDPSVVIASSPAPPTRRIAEVVPERIVRLDADRQIIELPININGWMRLDASTLGPAGTEVTLTHGESLADDGDVDMAPLLAFDFMTQAPLGHGQVDHVVSAGPEGPDFEPRHTTHGFQYVRVDGAPDLDIDKVRGVLVHTDLTRTGWFTCSEPMLDRLHDAAVLSFVDNACEIPTDCPQRERAGWTGDWQLFVPTAAFLFDVAGFTDRWLRDLASDQWPDGRVTNFVPDPSGPEARSHPVADFMTGSSGWGDAATIVPFEMWRAYGDLDLLRRQYPSMVAWVEWALGVARDRRHATREAARPIAAPHEEYLWDAGFHWGEWSEPGAAGADNIDVLSGKVDQGYVATAYLARSLGILAETAALLGDDRADEWGDLQRRVRAAWASEYLDANGHLTVSTQATLCRALAFDLIPIDARDQILSDLIEEIEAADFHITTGFLTTPYLLPTLADCGRIDMAYRLLLQRSAPSWLVMMDAGATTIWENWERPTAEHPGSANHYSKGAVVSFLHRYVAGLRPIDGVAAYERFLVAPMPGGGIESASARLDTPRGRISVAWRRADAALELDLLVPPAATAEVLLPSGERFTVGTGQHSFRGAWQGV